jgi:superfamily II DNA or RNA helicase
MKLRPYQQEAFDSTMAAFASGHRRVLVCMATGGGKTILFAHLAQSMPRCLVLAHRHELVEQAHAKLMAATGIVAGVDTGRGRAGTGAATVVSSVQTMRKRGATYRGRFDLVVCDEAHHAASAEWVETLGWWPEAKVFGVTATPDRADKKCLRKIFDCVAFDKGILELTREGWLCPLKAKRMETEVDFTTTRTRGEISEDEAAEKMHPILEALADETVGEIWDRKTVIFLPRRDVSEKFSRLLAAKGIAARHVDGASQDRTAILKWFAEPGPKAICNAMLLTEGFDQPDVDCIAPFRPVRSRGLYSQIVGRGTRISPGKDHCLILDPFWLTGSLNLCQPADLVATSPMMRQAMRQQLDLGMDMLEAEAVAKVDVEQRLARQLIEAKKQEKAPKGLVDPLAFGLAIHDSELISWTAEEADGEEPATPEQMAELKEAGIWPEKFGMCRELARVLLHRVAMRKSLGLASPKQLAALHRFGVTNAELLTAGQAGIHLAKRFR